MTEARGHGVFFKPPKNGRSRVVHLGESLTAALRRYKLAQKAARLAAYEYHDQGLVLTRLDGSPVRPQTFSQAFRALIERCDVPPVRLHDLRHTHATLMLRAGVHPKVASSRLGHSSSGITLDLYSHVLPSMDREAADLFESLVREESLLDAC